MTNPHQHPPAAVYAAAFDTYRQAGWQGILPLPPRRKHPVPAGWTGNHGAWPSYADLYAWSEDRPDANIALRLPETVIGIDVDAYGEKGGGTTLALLETTFGPLPATWRTTSRDDGVSGIRLYRAPAGLRWPSVAGASIEIIRHAHRYAIVWPSVHPNGGTYRWINPAGTVTIGEVPTPDDLPLLPPAWVDGLTNGRQAAGDRQRADLTDHQATTWLAERPAGTPCPAVQRVLAKRTADLTTPGTTRHDAMLEATQRLAYLAAEGHQGVPTALHTLEHVFLQLVTKDGTRDPREAELEWDRALTGAIRNAAIATLNDGDPCTNPYASLTAQAPTSPTELVRQAKETETWTPPAQPATTPGATTTGPNGAGTDGTSTSTTNTADPSSKDATADSPSPDAAEDPPPSWRPIDLTPYLDGTWTPDQPTLLTRTDGQALLYPGKVHDFHGESESGKSLVAQAAAATEIAAGRPVLYVDFEDDAGPVTQRLLAMGATAEQLQAHFTYVRPETSPYALTEAAEWATLLTHQFTLAVLDGVTDALVQFGAGTKENDDITAWHRAVPRMLARRTGAAVLLVDHVIKNQETRGRFAIGGQAKMAALDGASYSVEVTKPIGKGMAGTISLRIGKDRPGEIRANCGAWRALDRTQEAAQITIDSTHDNNTITVTINPPTTSVTDQHDDGRPFRPTGIMEKLSRLVEASREPLSQNKLLQAYKTDGGGARDVTVYEAINILVDERHFTEERGPRGARILRSANVYRQHTDPESDAYRAPIDLPGSDMSTPFHNESITNESAGQHHFPPLPTSSRPLPGRSQEDGTTSSHGRVSTPTGAPLREEVSTSAPEKLKDEPTSSQHPNHKTPGPEWRLDYASGEYVNRHTGELWDGGEPQ